MTEDEERSDCRMAKIPSIFAATTSCLHEKTENEILKQGPRELRYDNEITLRVGILILDFHQKIVQNLCLCCLRSFFKKRPNERSEGKE